MRLYYYLYCHVKERESIYLPSTYMQSERRLEIPLNSFLYSEIDSLLLLLLLFKEVDTVELQVLVEFLWI